MVVRRCSQGHSVYLYLNTSPGLQRSKTYRDGAVHSLTYPSAIYKYFVVVGGSIVKKTSSLKTAEEYYTSECDKKHTDSHGRLLIGKHQMINGVSTSQSDYPTNSNTKDEIKAFYDIRNIKYISSMTKKELLDIIETDKHGTKHIK